MMRIVWVRIGASARTFEYDDGISLQENRIFTAIKLANLKIFEVIREIIGGGVKRRRGECTSPLSTPRARKTKSGPPPSGCLRRGTAHRGRCCRRR